MLNKLKNKTWVLLFHLLKKIVLPIKSNRVLIVKLDSVGDYVLFRNYLYFLKSQPDYKDLHFSLLGNIAFRSLAEEYDSTIVDKFIWTKPSIVHNHQLRKLILLCKIKLRRFDLIINPMHSRRWEIDEFISSLGGKRTIGSEGDSTHFDSYKKFITASKFYNELIKVSDTCNFEFYRNRVFFENLTTSNERLPALNLPILTKKVGNNICIIVVPGAGEAFRRWSPKNFAATINILHEKFNCPLNIYITGTGEESSLAKEIISNVNPNILITDLTGILSLPDLVNKITCADLVISNETSAVHIAAATTTNAICISNGNHFGRFNPYPEDLASNIYTLYPNQKFYQKEKIEELLKLYNNNSSLDINNIGVDTVASLALRILNK